MLAPHDVQEAQEPDAWLEQLRRPALALNGYAMVMDMPETPATGYHTLDRWGYQPQAIDVMHRLKAQWDPQGIFPGEFLYSSHAVPSVVSRS